MMKKFKIPYIKIFRYEVGFMPTPSRDDGVGVSLEIHLCCNKFQIYLTYDDIDKFEISMYEFKEKYMEVYLKFLKEYNSYKFKNGN